MAGYDIRYHIVWITKYRHKDHRARQRNLGQYLWARGYFYAAVGFVTEEMIKDYIKCHNEVNRFSLYDDFQP